MRHHNQYVTTVESSRLPVNNGRNFRLLNRVTPCPTTSLLLKMASLWVFIRIRGSSQLHNSALPDSTRFFCGSARKHPTKHNTLSASKFTLTPSASRRPPPPSVPFTTETSSPIRPSERNPRNTAVLPTRRRRVYAALQQPARCLYAAIGSQQKTGGNECKVMRLLR